ncbi:MAG: SGNH/GDSL hydrolase family protein [Candidatus Bathyarchaeota archaeon]|nr:SGNH/GDSL hydrolase family protein [Candidatus Bathyarchaeota archaeon]
MDAPETITFVALGDSLTYGFVPFGRGLPYTSFLDNMVIVEQGRRGLGDVDFVFVNLGVNGDTTRGMLSRLESEVAPIGADYVIVWGGINDLFGGKSPPEVMENLRKIYARSRELGVEPVACTLTSIVHQNPIVPRIWELNDLIRTYCAENRIRLVDLFRTTSDESGFLMEGYSSDGAHLNAEGNRRIASTVYTEFVEQILDELIR